MSAMSFREPNEVLWRGVRPAHKGTQVVKSRNVDDGIVIIHTVSPGKTLFLNAASLMQYANADHSLLSVRDTDDVFLYDILAFSEASDIGHRPNATISFPVPLEIPAGYDIHLIVGPDGGSARCFIHGWEE